MYTIKISSELRPGDVFFGGSNTENLDKSLFSIDYNHKDSFKVIRVLPDPKSLGWATKVEAICLTDNRKVTMVLSNSHLVSVSS